MCLLSPTTFTNMQSQQQTDRLKNSSQATALQSVKKDWFVEWL